MSYLQNLPVTPKNKNIKIIEINDIDKFREMEKEWNSLLIKSNANKLFLGWEWQYTWWETWGGKPDLRLILLKAYHDNELVGIAPLYLDSVRLRRFIPIRRIQFIGNAWLKWETVRTEYLEFILSRDNETEVARAFIEYLYELNVWDEFIICDLLRCSATYLQIMALKSEYSWLVLIAKLDQGIRIDTCGSFKQYLETLGRNTRLKLYNRRKYLETLGRIQVARVKDDDVHVYFGILNDFHQKRWGRSCFFWKSLMFHQNLIKRLGPEKSKYFTCIKVDSEPVSISYNLRIGDTIFNLQSGYVESYDKKLSLGTLHMGMIIEEAFKEEDIRVFDMLAGSGKSEFYKRNYKGEAVEFITLQVTRNVFIRAIRYIYDKLPDEIKNTVSKLVSLFRR